MPEAAEVESSDSEVSPEIETSTSTETTQSAETAESKETTASTPESSETAAREKLEASVREKLDALNADEDEPEATEEKPSDAPPEAEKPAKEAAAAVTPAPTLPESHVRSLKAFGLDDAAIAKTSPEVAAALHARRNQEITRWAEQGRQAKAATQTPTQPAATQAAVAAPAAKPALDIAALKQQYGDEPLIAALEAQQKEIAEFRDFQKRANEQVQQQQLEALGRNIDGFFSSKSLAAYRAVYGAEAAKASPEQLAKRQEVLQLADVIVGGAAKEGIRLTLDQALQHAFDAVAAPLAKQAARQEIAKELKTRAKGLSLKPGGRPTTPAPSSRKEMEKNVKSRLKEVFNS
jgi:hypothetical protein